MKLAYHLIDFLPYFIFFGILYLACREDLKSMTLPDRFTIGGALIGLVISGLIPSLHNEFYSFNGVFKAATGIIVGSGVLLWIAILAEACLKKDAVGFGDVKLMGCIGAFCGWQGAIFAIFSGSLIGCLILLPIAYVRGKKTISSRIPFGPFLAAGALAFSVIDSPGLKAIINLS